MAFLRLEGALEQRLFGPGVDFDKKWPFPRMSTGWTPKIGQNRQNPGFSACFRASPLGVGGQNPPKKSRKSKKFIEIFMFIKNKKS